jgi:hypothetical protein
VEKSALLQLKMEIYNNGSFYPTSQDANEMVGSFLMIDENKP